METKTPFIEIIDEIKKAGGDTYRMCFQCGTCDAVCPWNNVRNFSIRRLIREAAFGLTEIESDDVWLCTTCGKCHEHCPRAVDQIKLGISLRRLASSYDIFAASASAVKAARGSLVAEGNPLDEDRAKRAEWTEGLSVNPYTEDTEILFFGCCYLSYDPRMRSVAAATAKILNKAGISYGILGTSESCCGESIRKTGAEDVYKGLAKENIKTFVDNGVKKIVVSSPHCYESFKNEYSEFMVNFEVVHMSQLLLDLIKEGRIEITREYAKTVTYHDPCYLGRHNEIFDEPREILGRIPGLELNEMAASRKNSLCCGGGGGRVWMETEKGERFSDLRLEQARDTGAAVLVTACPYCISMFEDSRVTLELESDIEIKDITEVLQEVIEV
ncbi:MAG: (Fe-S)-binding protein [Candidatus Latescibacterota bacterium]|nr:MAG: (Fe-S)-binding protein [Candidatus Latescibacterota bacterium]